MVFDEVKTSSSRIPHRISGGAGSTAADGMTAASPLGAFHGQIRQNNDSISLEARHMVAATFISTKLAIAAANSNASHLEYDSVKDVGDARKVGWWGSSEALSEAAKR